MKVGSLIRTLFLLLILPSATVLSLFGSIDRSMKTGVALLLLSSFHIIASDLSPSQVDLCKDEKMICFVPGDCAGSNKAKIKHISDEVVANNCKMIMKIRPYSATMYRVILESRDHSVTKIQVKRADDTDIGNIFSCGVGSEPEYKTAIQKSIKYTPNPLMCEFIVKDDSENFPTPPTGNPNIAIITNDELEPMWSKISLALFSAPIGDKFCDPAIAVYDPRVNNEDYSLTEPTIGLEDITCEAPFELQTRYNRLKQPEIEFIKTKSIECEKYVEDHKSKYKLKVDRDNNDLRYFNDAKETFNVRCAVKTCTLCNYQPPGPNLTIFQESDGCKALKCKTGKLNGDSMGVATCKKNGDKSTWDLNGKTIEKDTKVTCETKLECRSPVLFSCRDDETMILNSKIVSISCNNNTGNWAYYQEGAVVPNPDPAELGCLSKESKGSNGTNSQTNSQASGTTIGCIVGGVLILIALIAGIAIYLNRRRNAQNNIIGKTTKSQEAFSVQLTSKSKESKKEPNICMGVDMSTVPTTPSATPISPQPYKRPPPPRQGGEGWGDATGTGVGRQSIPELPRMDYPSFNDVDVKKKISPQEIAEMHKAIDKVMLNAADIPSNATTGTDGIKRKKVTPDGGTNMGGDTTGAETGPFNIDEAAINKKGFRRDAASIAEIDQMKVDLGKPSIPESPSSAEKSK